jgi:hypothetical protein
LFDPVAVMQAGFEPVSQPPLGPSPLHAAHV